MDIEKLKKTLTDNDHWFAIQREKARQQGFYYVEDLGGYWDRSDREIYLLYHKPMKILYIHGLSSSGASSTASTLRKFLPDDTIFSPDLPIEPQEAMAMLRQLVEREQIDLAIGTSMGAMFAQKLQGYNKILVNPSFHVSRSMRRKLGTNEFFSPRADGATHYEITEDLCDRYEELERTQFDNITDHEREITLGLFGAADEVVDCSEEFRQHYTRFSRFDGGHRLTERDIRNVLLYEIEKFRKHEQEPNLNNSVSILDLVRAKSSSK